MALTVDMLTWIVLSAFVILLNAGNGLRHHFDRPGDVVSRNRRSSEFGYEGEHGPNHWSEDFGSCAGKFQSPIDIEEHDVQHVSLQPLVFEGFDAQITGKMVNNGHTVMIEVNTTKDISISGGPLHSKYLFNQLHFHWGSNDSVGSEDTINNHSFPMELHLVFYNKKYKDINQAMQHKDGLTVLAFFFEIDKQEDNKAYAGIIGQLPKIYEAKTHLEIKKKFDLNSILVKNRHMYYTYNGSLTTPPCLEVVTWIDFKQPIWLSHNQIQVFRNIHSEHGILSHNFRPVQPLGGRTVLFNVANQEKNFGRPSQELNSNLLVITLLVLSLYIKHS